MIFHWITAALCIAFVFAQGKHGRGGLLGGLNDALEQTKDKVENAVGSVTDSVGGVDVLDELKDLHKGGKKLSKKLWRKKARKFCKRFPGHQNCRKGKVPNPEELSDLVNGFKGGIGKFLPKVPRLRKPNPLKDVNEALKKHLKDIPMNLGEIHAENAAKIRDICKKRKCREQPEHAKKKKQLIAAKLAEFEKKLTGKDSTDAVQLRFDRTLQLKQALLEKGNLTDTVEPVDDGVFDVDMMLTEGQANLLLNELDKDGEGADEIPLPDSDSEDSDTEPAPPSPTVSRARRASIFFEQNVVQKWDTNTPVKYVFDDSVEELDRNDVRAAIYEIETKTCVRFQELKTAPSGYHIVYYKVDSPTFCGLSYVGRVDPANPIYLSFACENSRGVAVHETMHALGVAHQHLRMDRDQYITVNWNNIDPQQYDAFVVVDSKIYSTYGVKYAYDSIMHYNAYTAAQNINIATMTPKTNPATNLSVLGQRKQMSASDVEILKKMYCMPGCEDKNVYCGAWALQDLCKNPNHDVFMANNCKKSCNLCVSG